MFIEHGGFFEKLNDIPYHSDEGYQRFRPLFNFILSELNKMLEESSANETIKHDAYAEILNDWLGYVKRLNSRKESMFGYPGNLTKRSFLVDFFRIMESFEVFQNNCGNILDISDIESSDEFSVKQTNNNYAMDTKSIEWDIVRLVADNLGLPEQPKLVVISKNPKLYKQGFWGYVTSGSSESNMWGIQQGFKIYPNGVLYFCESSHYSIHKAGKPFSYKIIPQKSVNSEAIDYDILLREVESGWCEYKNPAIIVLTFGTTKYGSVDDIALIKQGLVRLGIPHYMHIDAAFFGGIPKNQDNSPKIGDVEEWGYDSIGVSLHKYIGYPAAKGVLISVKRPSGEFIDYIGQVDNTVLGSRDIPAFSLKQQVMEILKYSDPKDYIRNIDVFEDMLNMAKIKFISWRDGKRKGNTFVFKVNKCIEEYHSICKRWQLSEFVSKDGFDLVHVIIFPSHTQKNITLLVKDLAKITDGVDQ